MTELENRLIASLTVQVERTEQLTVQVNALSAQLEALAGFDERLNDLAEQVDALATRLETLYGPETAATPSDGPDPAQTQAAQATTS